MTDRTQPHAGSIHIIRYALELGLLWIDGDGRNKVREALDALDALEAKLASIGAGVVQALSAAQAEALGYFSFSDECGFDRHDTAEAAKAAATEMLSEIRRELGGDEWPMDVESICWGVVVERATEHDQTTGEDSEKYCDYVLKGAPPTPPAEQKACDTQLFKFYGVSTTAELIAAQARHIEKLQAKIPPTPSFAPQRVREG